MLYKHLHYITLHYMMQTVQMWLCYLQGIRLRGKDINSRKAGIGFIRCRGYRLLKAELLFCTHQSAVLVVLDSVYEMEQFNTYLTNTEYSQV